MTKQDVPPQVREHHQTMVLHSALWAAAGDALGWITELSHGESGVRHRMGANTVTRPVTWVRTIGGRHGPKVELPAGTYSDDTQLRLAVSRSIRGNGSFDVEAFAKIELTVWPTYALGGGLGTKAAASNLARRGVNWFSNLFETGRNSYVASGGNGAAMRIQPHVWCSPIGSSDFLLDVLRNALVTHGHPHGFCGAILHALVLESAFSTGSLPSVATWASFVERFAELPQLISDDPQLAAFWKSAWESSAKVSLEAALGSARDEALNDIHAIEHLLGAPSPSDYHKILDLLGCLTTKFRGSGLKTVLASMALAELFRHDGIEGALACAANELESDTDTIATMAGALLGSVSRHAPEWPIQDIEYITRESSRLAAIACHIPQTSFGYPDLGRWNPPAKQNASVGLYDGGLAIVGLGQLVPMGGEYRNGDAVWQWCALKFGQTILAKRKIELEQEIPANQLPGPAQEAQREIRRVKSSPSPSVQPRLPLNAAPNAISRLESEKASFDLIDKFSDEAISSGFDNATLGRLLNECIDSTNSVEATVGFAAIVAKAKLARLRRRR
jgi:ADP-ribosylglycohydrolase